MKKKILVTAVILVGATVIAGCSSGKSESRNTVTFTVPSDTNAGYAYTGKHIVVTTPDATTITLSCLDKGSEIRIPSDMQLSSVYSNWDITTNTQSMRAGPFTGNVYSLNRFSFNGSVQGAEASFGDIPAIKTANVGLVSFHDLPQIIVQCVVPKS